MRVLIDTTFAHRAPWSGTAVYLTRISAALAAVGGLEVVEVWNGRRRPPAGGGAGSVRNVLADAWWTTVELPRHAHRARAEVIHHPLPAHSPSTRLPQVVTVHDLAFERLPDRFDRAYRTYARLAHRAAARRADAVICVSETTAADVRAAWGVRAERIVVARHGPGQELPSAGSPASGQSNGYFLYVGDDEPRKNLGVLLEAYRTYRHSDDGTGEAGAHRPLDLVLAGSASAAGEGIRVSHHPGAEVLGGLYAGAAALVHPSAYEGFGLTALEAMRAGVPVLAARSWGVVEVCGDAARYVEPGDTVGLAGAMAELARQPSLRAALGERGRRRAEDFSWAASARAHLDAYSLAVTGSRP